jgi:hypothetical protein
MSLQALLFLCAPVGACWVTQGFWTLSLTLGAAAAAGVIEAKLLSSTESFGLLRAIFRGPEIEKLNWEFYFYFFGLVLWRACCRVCFELSLGASKLDIFEAKLLQSSHLKDFYFVFCFWGVGVFGRFK